MAVTAGWPLHRLVDALARAGWGPLAGRQPGGVRAVLGALARALPSRSAAGLVTANQLADMAGLSERWTRSCLAVLERAQLIKWTRGTVIDGRPAPSYIRVSKDAIAALVLHARRELPERLRQRATETAQRITSTLRLRTIHRANRRPNPARPIRALGRAELSSTPPSLYREEVPRRADPAPPDEPPPPPGMYDSPAARRATLATLRAAARKQSPEP